MAKTQRDWNSRRKVNIVLLCFGVVVFTNIFTGVIVTHYNNIQGSFYGSPFTPRALSLSERVLDNNHCNCSSPVQANCNHPRILVVRREPETDQPLDNTTPSTIVNHTQVQVSQHHPDPVDVATTVPASPTQTPTQQNNSRDHTDPVDVATTVPASPTQQINPQDPHMPTIFVITPTYHRITQKVDMTSMCYTLMHVPKLVWIVVEDSTGRTKLVTKLLERCKVQSVHLNVKTPKYYSIKPGSKTKPRGVAQRNAALHWLRTHHSLDNCNGVVYFGDDDNKYDLRLFEEIRKTKSVSVFIVGFSTRLKYEGPVCKDGKAIAWHTAWAPGRKFPVDMAGFAIHLRNFIKKPKVGLGMDMHGHLSKNGYLEPDLLSHFASHRSSVECRGSNTEVYVWHSHTSTPSFGNEKIQHSNSKVEYK